MSSNELASLAKSLQDVVNVKSMFVSNAALLTYDTLVNFGDEVQYIWNSSWSLGKCLYIASRYLAFVDVTIHLNLVFDSGITINKCRRLYTALPWTMTVGVVVAEVILILRTFAIYSRSYLVLAFLVCMRVGTLAPSMYINVQWNSHMTFSPSPAPRILPCVYVADGKGDAWIDFLFIAIFDSCIVVLTFYKFITQWRSGLSRASLLSTIYRDGLSYFIVLFVISVINAVLLKVEGDRGSPYFDFFGLFQRVVQGILSSRLIINVRKALLSPLDDFTTLDPLATPTIVTRSNGWHGHTAQLSSTSQLDGETETFEMSDKNNRNNYKARDLERLRSPP